MNRPYRQRLGQWGEKQAEAYLAEKGFQILFCNVRTAYGEIDLVCRHQDELVFVEVKTRSSTTYGHPEAAVTATKMSHLSHSVEIFLQEHPELTGDWRMDVVAILSKDQQTTPEIVHFENVSI